MKSFLLLMSVCSLWSCKQSPTEELTADEIINRVIEEAGGDHYTNRNISFFFRDREYQLQYLQKQRILKRITFSDTATIVDIKKPDGFQRFVNDSVVEVADTTAVKYSNSINAVHYFAYLPYGLNDPAVNKRLLGDVVIKKMTYYKIEVSFDKEGGGKDYEDVYIYWINKDSFKADYLAYIYHVDEGGIRFREAYNERYVDGIRFVDYRNYEAPLSTPLHSVDELFEKGRLTLLSRIELREIKVF